MQKLRRFVLAVVRWAGHPYAIAVPLLGWILATELVWQRYREWRAQCRLTSSKSC